MFSGLTLYLLGAGAVLLSIIGAYMKGTFSGARAERDKQARERLEARSEADKIDDAVAGLSDEEVMKEQAKWSRKR